MAGVLETRAPIAELPAQHDAFIVPSRFGFKTGSGGAHASRTMMLSELTILFAATAQQATKAAYFKAVIEENRLGKRTTSNRRLTARNLTDLYGLDPSLTVFRLLRFFWTSDPKAHPLLALLCASGRDSLLRLSAQFVLRTKPGEILGTLDFVEFFNGATPGRFSEAMVQSLSQNVASSWTQAGFFKGKMKKTRQRPVVSPAAAAYALALGYLCGLRGQLLLDSRWAKLLDIPRAQVIALAQEASKRGWLDFKGSGNIFEINFPQLLTPKEIEASHGPD